ncbi:MAG: hypothetical protein R8J94_06310 [Acidimicrobiia bacterium]|nr:hypothetical protein [Acidimicrobiia bacterium]
MERRIARRYVTDSLIEIWIPRKGVLGRARTAELPVADLSMFGSSVFANKSDRLARGQVLEVRLGSTKTTAIVRSEQSSGEGDGRLRYGLEFINPTDEFLSEVRLITETCRRIAGEDVGQEQLWLRSS